MEAEHQGRVVDGALSEIEQDILPSVSLLLDSLLEAATAARAGADAESHACDLRRMAGEIEALTVQVAALMPAWNAYEAPEPVRISA